MARRRMQVEPLEDRRMLSVNSGTGLDADEAIKLYSTSTALFVENQGQWQDESLRYAFDGPGVNIGFTNQGLSFLLTEREEIESEDERNDPLDPLVNDPLEDMQYTTRSTQFSISFEDANVVTPVALQQSQSRFNYLLGESATHRSSVGGYEVVAYEDLYAGIDLHTFGRRNSLKYEFYVAPGADYQQIEVSYEGIKGLWIDDTGALHVETELGPLVDDAPYIYQVIDGEEVEVAGRFRLIDVDTYTFEITGVYDASVELVVDPNLDWGSYLGGGSDDVGRGIAVDGAGNVLVTGYTKSAGWVSGGWDVSYGDSGMYADAFVVKLNANGEHIWSSYFGGGNYDFGNGIAVDSVGSVVVTGSTHSGTWASGGWDTSYGGISDGFVVKFASNGGHLWSSYLGGGGDREEGNGITVDAADNILITGATHSSGWVSGGWDTTFGGLESEEPGDGFVVKLASSGAHLWSSYVGGTSDEIGEGIAVDADGRVLVTGSTSSANWVSGGWDTSVAGSRDGFVVKLDIIGAHLWSSYLGGSSQDTATDIATDAAGNVLITGETYSAGWVSGGWDSSRSGTYADGFVVRLNSGGVHLWSTFLGGSSHDAGGGIAIDSAGDILVTGGTDSAGWVSGAWDTSLGGIRDGFIVKLASNGGHVWSSYLGGSDGDGAWDIAIDATDNLLVTGATSSTGWLSGGWDPNYAGLAEGFVVRIKESQTGDFDNDGDVDGRDFLMWQRNPSIGDLSDWRQHYGEEGLAALSSSLSASQEDEELGLGGQGLDVDEKNIALPELAELVPAYKPGGATHVFADEYVGEVDRAFEQLSTVPQSRAAGFGEMVARRHLRRPTLIDFAF